MKTSSLSSTKSLPELLQEQMDCGIGVGAEIYTENIAVQKFIEFVCDYFSVSFFNLIGRNRKRKYVFPRQLILCIVKEFYWNKTKFSLREMGLLFDRDHSTVIHSQHTIYALAETDPRIRRTVQVMRAKLRALSEQEGSKIREEVETKSEVFFEMIGTIDGLSENDLSYWVMKFEKAI